MSDWKKPISRYSEILPLPKNLFCGFHWNIGHFQSAVNKSDFPFCTGCSVFSVKSSRCIFKRISTFFVIFLNFKSFVFPSPSKRLFLYSLRDKLASFDYCIKDFRFVYSSKLGTNCMFDLCFVQNTAYKPLWQFTVSGSYTQLLVY